MKGETVMMNLGIKGGGSMVITDNNETVVSKEIMDQINKEYQKPDGADDSKKPEMTLKD